MSTPKTPSAIPIPQTAAAMALDGQAVNEFTPPPKTRPFQPSQVIGPAIVFGLFVGFWYVAHYVLMSDNRKFLLPPPHEVVHDSFLTWSVSGKDSLANIAGGGFKDQLDGLWLSTQVAMLGLAIAITIGIALATVMSQAKWIEQAIYPYLVALQAMPILAFVPLIGVLWGFEFRSRVLVVVIIAIFPIVANTLFGLLSVDRSYHELMTLNGASRLTRLRKLQFPAAMPSIFTGLQISAGLAVIGAIVGDFFFRQGQPGIGQLIDRYRASLAYSQMYGAVILSAMLGIVVFTFFGWLGKRVVGHWHESGSG